jgi:PTS system fructose-specific IIC component
MPDLITSALVRLDADLGSEKHDVIRALARIVSEAGRTTDPDRLADDAIAREGTAPTGLAGGIAIPHCRTVAVDEPTLAFVRLSPQVEFGAKDGPADLAFLIAAPSGGDATHLQLLTKLARALVKPDFTAGLRHASTEQEVVDLVREVVGDSPAQATATATPAQTTQRTTASGIKSLVAVTACPTGIAHTYMAAEALRRRPARPAYRSRWRPRGRPVRSRSPPRPSRRHRR